MASTSLEDPVIGISAGDPNDIVALIAVFYTFLGNFLRLFQPPNPGDKPGF